MPRSSPGQATIHVVLVEPEIPQNTGNVARTCAAVGAELHLIHPLGFRVDDRSVRRAGLDYWDQVTVHEHESLRSFLVDHRDDHLYLFSRRGTTCYTETAYHWECYLLFGRETSGLPADLLEGHRESVVRIPTTADARCLNLSNAVAVGVYEVLRQRQFSGQQICATGTGRPASNG